MENGKFWQERLFKVKILNWKSSFCIFSNVLYTITIRLGFSSTWACWACDEVECFTTHACKVFPPHIGFKHLLQAAPSVFAMPIPIAFYGFLVKASQSLIKSFKLYKKKITFWHQDQQVFEGVVQFKKDENLVAHTHILTTPKSKLPIHTLT
jgi:hypothetical protein